MSLLIQELINTHKWEFIKTNIYKKIHFKESEVLCFRFFLLINKKNNLLTDLFIVNS